MQPENELVWTVVESSPAGETTVGVYTTLTRAREVVSELADGNYEDYRIEGHALDHGKEMNAPWQVHLTRDGTHLQTLPFAGCACADDEAEFLRRSFVERDGEAMSVIAFAPTPGIAIASAQRYREWLVEQDLWSPGLQLQPIQSAPGATTITA